MYNLPSSRNNFLIKLLSKGENMKKHIFIISVIVFLSLGFISLNLTKINAISSNEPIPVEQEYYILKSYNNKIALFSSQRESPIEIFDIYTDSLPDYDKEKLRQGIKAYSEAELNKILETYLS